MSLSPNAVHMISKDLPDVPLKGLVCLVFIGQTKQVRALSTCSIAPSVGSYATARAAPALPPALSALPPPFLACDTHAPTPLLVTRRSRLYQVSKQE